MKISPIPTTALVSVAVLFLLVAAVAVPSAAAASGVLRRGGGDGHGHRNRLSTAPPGSLLPFRNWSLPISERVQDLVGRLSLDEKIQQLWSIAPAIPRLNITAYNWRSNCLHGWTANGGKFQDNEKWTVFPSPIGLGASFDRKMVNQVGNITAVEGRALHNLGVKEFGSSTEARGLNCFGPTINVLRDPRWGRNMEVYSEDPFVVSELSVSFIDGLHGENTEYLNVASCAKHFAAHDGPDDTREFLIANVSDHDMYDYYLPQFKAVIDRTALQQVMCAYSAVNRSGNAPDCANPDLLRNVLRGEFGFSGSVMSDNGAVEQVYSTHHFASSLPEAAGMCLNASCDCDLGYDAVYSKYLGAAIDKGFTSVAMVDESLSRLLTLRFRVGEFDPAERVPYSAYGLDELWSPAHEAANRESAQKSMVLFRNPSSILPLTPDSGSRIAVIGPLADDAEALLGNYAGIPQSTVSILDGLKQASAANGREVLFDGSCVGSKCPTLSNMSQTLKVAASADVIILVLGIDGDIEGEGMDRSTIFPCTSPAGATQPESVIDFPGCQSFLMRQIIQLNIPTVLVIVHGGGITSSQLLNAPIAVLDVFYPGDRGGLAVADVIFGAVSPAGRYPYTTIMQPQMLPRISDYSLTTSPGRTYRYSTALELAPFGYGLSYTTFQYSQVTLIGKTSDFNVPCATLKFKFTLQNTGHTASDEVVQVYVEAPQSQSAVRCRNLRSDGVSDPAALRDCEFDFPVPGLSLKYFDRIHLNAGQSITSEFSLPPSAFALVNEKGESMLYPGLYILNVGGRQPGDLPVGLPESTSGAPLSSWMNRDFKPTPLSSCSS